MRALDNLAKRVGVLEADVNQVRANISLLCQEMQQIEGRSLRGEVLLMQMQQEQRRMSKVIDSIAVALKVCPPPVVEITQDELDAQAAERLVNSEEVIP